MFLKLNLNFSMCGFKYIYTLLKFNRFRHLQVYIHSYIDVHLSLCLLKISSECNISEKYNIFTDFWFIFLYIVTSAKRSESFIKLYINTF